MKRFVSGALLAGSIGVGLAACGSSSDGADSDLTVTWKFESGDCASNGIDKVRATLTPQGKPGTTKEVACTAGKEDLGSISVGSYGVLLEAVDSAGTTRFTSSATASFPDGKVLAPFDLTLHAKPSNVTVTWRGCPPSVILPYQITLFRAGADGKATTVQGGQTSGSCQASKAVVQGVPPGDYIADLDDRAVTPAVHATAPVTVKAGEDVTVAIAAP